jgi:hypothetical protein
MFVVPCLLPEFKFWVCCVTDICQIITHYLHSLLLENVEKSRPHLWSSGQSSCLLNGDVLCFLWGTNWIYICYVEESTPPLWSSCQSSWLQRQRPGFDSRRYQIFWEVVGLKQGLSRLISTIEELLGRKISGSGLKIREYANGEPSRWPHDILYQQMLTLSSLPSAGLSVGIIRPRTKATEPYYHP